MSGSLWEKMCTRCASEALKETELCVSQQVCTNLCTLPVGMLVKSCQFLTQTLHGL